MARLGVSGSQNGVLPKETPNSQKGPNLQ